MNQFLRRLVVLQPGEAPALLAAFATLFCVFASYTILRSTTGGGTYSALTGSPTSPSFTDTTASAGTTYYYEVKAVNTAGTSAASAYVSALTIPATPSLFGLAGFEQISLGWGASTGATSYKIYRYDGSGYPDGLAGEAIPIEARIVSACDAFDAMTTTRSYRQAMSREMAIAELRRDAGVQFDPIMVDAFVKTAHVDGVPDAGRPEGPRQIPLLAQAADRMTAARAEAQAVAPPERA